MAEVNKEYKYLYYKYKNKYINLKKQLNGGGALCSYVNTVNKDDCRDPKNYIPISNELKKIIADPSCAANKQKAESTLSYCTMLKNTVTAQNNSLPPQLQQRQTSQGYVVPPTPNEPAYLVPQNVNNYAKFKDVK